ncbi:MAG: hypothetical protein LUC24_03725 [Bacteroidales bacterium]|nr:hypothetical protein [Bacteroidales bacterium]
MLAPGKDLVQIARVLKANGTDGKAVLGLRDIDPDDLNTVEPVFIYFDGSPVPFFIESLVRRGRNKVLVSLTGIRSIEDVDEILGAEVYVEAGSLPEGEWEDDSFLVGWTLYDGGSDKDSLADKNSNDINSYNRIGTITDFVDIPGNPCIEVSTENGVAMIPLHQDLIESLDEDSQVIVMNIPSGLI